MTQSLKISPHNSKFPDFLQKSVVGFMFNLMYPFTDEDIFDLTEFCRALWTMEQNYIHQQETRLELMRVLIKVKNIKIKNEMDNQVSILIWDFWFES